MNKKIKVIDLLNKIANGEEVPKKIKFNDEIFLYIGKWEQYVTEEEEIPLLRRICDYNYSGLNDEVEILEDNTEEIEELDEEWTYIEGQIEKTWSKSELELVNKINEIIRYIKGKDKNND